MGMVRHSRKLHYPLQQHYRRKQEQGIAPRRTTVGVSSDPSTYSSLPFFLTVLRDQSDFGADDREMYSLLMRLDCLSSRTMR